VIDRGSLGDLVETLRTAYDGPDDKPEMIDHDELKKLCMCPACNELMETFNYCGPGNVVLDTCEGCKLTWLDQGELAMIVRAPGKRDYGAGRNQESELLRSQLYANANADSTAGAFLLGRLFM
jgi:Zn-finger nucleic acid-binding protein